MGSPAGWLDVREGRKGEEKNKEGEITIFVKTVTFVLLSLLL